MAMRPGSYGGTRRGPGSWLAQRATSLYMAGFVLFVALRFAWSPATDYAAWHGWWTGTATRMALALFVTSVLLHAWIGLRSIYMDYLHSWRLRFTVSAVTALVLALLALWAARLVLAA